MLAGMLVSLGLIAPAASADLTGPPMAPLGVAAEPGHVLIFSETAAFRHTEAITQGTPKIQEALLAAGITSDVSENSAVFTDANLAQYDAIVMFQTSGDPWTADEKAALQRYQQAGHGIAAIHNATDMRGNFQWWDNLVGSLMPGHAATGSSPGLPGEIIVEDHAHPSTKHLTDSRWARSDEWYNFSTNVRGTAHVLLSMDESTYAAGGNAMGYDHPIAWCKPYDGGRAFVTALGHFGSHYSEPEFLAHLVGGIQYAAGLLPGDCGGTVNANFEKVALDENTSAPFALDVAPDGRVFFTELVRGQVRAYDPATGSVKTALTLDVYSGGEDGLLGIAVDPDFATNHFLYVYYAPDRPNNGDPSSFFSQISRFTVDANSSIDPASERKIIDIPARREPDEPGHTGGALDFDLQGNLLIGVGDDVNPHSEPSGGYAPLSERAGTFHDARETSANTNDLRGKLLRITPSRGDATGYTVPEGNLFPEADDTQGKTRPEIYAMGFRNPFRFSVDPKTGWIGLADYAPDSGTDNLANRGPAGIVEWNLIKTPGNYGWPLCMGANEPFRDVDYTTSPVTVGAFFTCANPVNDSVRNTGLTNLPPARAPEMFYGYSKSSVPAVIPAGGGLAPMGGPFYDYDADLDSDVKFPEYFDGKAFFYEWSKNRVYQMTLDRGPATTTPGKLEKITRFLPNQTFLSPQDMKFGPDGALYTLEWGGGFGRDNPNSGIYRIDYINGSRRPVARATATPDNGQEPLTVSFSSAASSDPEGSALTFAWDFQDDGTVDSTAANPTFQYSAPGGYTVRLTVTDDAGKTGTTTIPVVVGNTRPQVVFDGPVNGGLIDWGDRISWDVTVTDPEDGTIDYQDLIVQPALGHDAHTHPTTEFRGRSGSLVTELGGGHSEDMKVFFALDARYTDGGGEGAPPMTGSSTIVLQPKHKEAEHADNLVGAEAGAVTGDPDGGGNAGLVGLGTGDWAAYEPINLTGIQSVTLRVASGQAGGTVELRNGSPAGPVLGTAHVPDTGGATRWRDVTVPVSASTQTMSLYLVFTGTANFRLNFLEFDGKGISPVAKPQVKLTSPADDQALEPGANTLTATATDAENAIAKVEFFVDGEKVGEDATAPSCVEWTETEEAAYVAHAVATNDEGLSSDSRKVGFTVGDVGIDPPFTTFASTEADFGQLGETFSIDAAGADVWQGTDQYGAIYDPAGAGENFVAQVKVDSFNGTHTAAKAGIMVRNDMTAPASAAGAGYVVLAQKGNGQVEFLYDTDGNGQLDSGPTVPVGAGAKWLRLTKYGTRFIAEGSVDGTTWVPVGDVDVPSAAAVQDIGMFVVSHIAGTKALGTFSGFSVDNDVEPPVDPGEPAPSCAGALSDEFDGDAVDEARWTTVRGAPTVSGGAAMLPVSNGDIDGTNQGAISYLGQAAPSGDWQATTKVTLSQDNEWQFAGLLLHVDDNNYSKVTFTKHSNDSRFFEFWSENNGTRQTHAGNVTVPAATGTTVYLRFAATGSTLHASYSYDGTAWTEMGTGAPLKANAKLGLVAAGDTDAQNQTAAFDWFRITPDEAGERPDPDDEFDGDALDGCRWDKIHNWHGERVDVDGGKLAIETFDADINGADNGAIENLILQTPPDGDWTVETKMTAPLKDNWQLAGLMLFLDQDHYVKYDIVADNDPGETPVRRVELRYEDGGGLTGPGGQDQAPPASPTDTWWLRLTKTGDTYTGQISADGQTWVATPGSVSMEFDGTPGIGLMAIGPQQSDGPIDVTFDHFEVIENAAPVIASATATPASGAAPREVEHDVEATDPDGDELEYSWDVDGDGTEDADTATVEHTYDEPGTYEAEVTVSDGDLGDSQTVTVTVSEVPNTPPVIGSVTATPPTGAAPLAVQVNAVATDADGDKLTYRWDFDGDGQADSSGASAGRVFAQPGTYEPEVTVSDGEASVTGTVTITVVPPEPGNRAPSVELTAVPAAGTAPLQVAFTAAGSDPDGDALAYSWSFGDGTTGEGATASHSYAAPGTYTATVAVRDPDGATDTASVTIRVNPASGPSGDPPAVTRLTGVGRPRIGGFARKGLRFTLRCGEVDGEAIARVRVTGKAARTLGRRTLATRTIGCSPDAALTSRVKPSKAVRKAILNAGMRNLKVTLQVALPDGAVLKKTVALKRR
jgi:PKD repeat protein/glucose/arabinose dehydrogenase/type 1 glutamine amidotransferase